MNLDKKKLSDEQIEILENGYTDTFEYLLEKLKQEYKSQRTVYEKVLKKKDEFEKLESDSKKIVINETINLMEEGIGNFKTIELSTMLGRKNGKSFETDSLLQMTFIDKSITGIYERRFKINWDGEQL